MTKHDNPANLSRRAVLMGAGALVVSVGAPVGIELLTGISEAYAQGAKPPLTPDQLSSYIAVNADGTVSMAAIERAIAEIKQALRRHRPMR